MNKVSVEGKRKTLYSGHLTASMEVINDSAAILSNHEVLSLLKDLKKPNKHQQNLATITYSTIKYLEKTPCKDQDSEIIASFLKATEPFKLTKAEKLQLLNQRPMTAVEIQLMVEESEERLTEEQVDELLDIVMKHLPGELPNEGQEGEEPMDDQ